MSSSKFSALVVATARESLRNKVELFFNLFFPLLFLLIFGTLYKDSDDYRKTFLGLYQSGGADVEQIIQDTGVWEVLVYHSEQELISAIKEGKTSIGLSYDGRTASYHYREGDLRQQSKLLLAQLSITAALEKQANKVQPVFVLSQTPVTAGKVMATGLDYIFAGILSISILSVGMMSVVGMFSRYRKSGVLKRLQITPLHPVSFILGSTFSRMIQSFITIFLILLASIFLLKASFEVNWLLFLITIFCSTLGMMALGLLLTLLFKNPETANSTAGILMFVMYFLAGIFFPLSLLPGYMRIFSSLLPLKYVSMLVRHSLGVETIPGAQFALISVSLALAGFVMLYLTGRKFLRSE